MHGVEIEGNNDLQFGDNTVTIKVTAEDGITVKTYTILVHRKTEEEEAMEQEAMEELSRQKEDSVVKNKVFNWWIVGGLIFILIIAIIILIWKRKRNSLN